MHPSTLFWLVSSRADTLVAVLATASMTPRHSWCGVFWAPDLCQKLMTGWMLGPQIWIHLCLCNLCILHTEILYTILICCIAFMDCFLANASANTPSFYSKCQPLQAERKFNILSSLCLTPASPPGKSWTVVISKNSRWVIYLLVPGIICSLHRAKTIVLERILFEEYIEEASLYKTVMHH